MFRLGRFVSELFRGNGIHHAATCVSRQPFLGPVRGVQSRIDAYEPQSGEIIYACTECGRLAVWKAGVLQADPVYELEHAGALACGEVERAAAENTLAGERESASRAARRPQVEPKKGRPPGSGLRIPSRDYLLNSYRALAARKGGPPTEVELAEKLEVSRTTLMDALKRLGLGWPPE
jgi:biotin operon repressor